MADARIVLSAEDRASRVLQGLRREMSSMEGGIGTLRSTLGALGPAFVGAFSVAGVLGLTRSVVNGLDKLNDLADATGASIENLSALEDIASRTGTSVDTMGDAIVKMNKALADAKPGSDQAAVFDALGLSIKDLKALDPVEAFQKLAVALQGFASDGTKARYVQELFGKSLREVAPLLKDTAEAGALIATVTRQQAEEAEKFNKQLFALEKSAADAGRALVGPLIAALNSTAEAYKRAREEGMSFLEFTLRRIGQDNRPGSGTEAEDRASRERATREALQVTNDLLERGTLTEERRNRLLDKRATLQKNLNAILVNQAVASASDIAQDPAMRRLLAERKLPDILGKPKARGGAGAAQRAGIAEIFDPAERFRASERAAQASVEEALRLDKLNDMTKERADALRLVSEEQARLNDLLDATPAGKLKQAQEDMLLLADAFEKGRISAEEFEQAASTRLGNVAEVAKAATDEWSVFADQAARNIQDVLGNTLEATLSGHFDGIGQMWKNMLIRMASEAAAAQLGKALFGDFGGKGGGSLGGLAGLLLSELPAFATGTPYVPQDMIAMVHKGERIIPASKNTANGAPGAAPMVFHNTYNVGAGVPLSQVVAVVQAGNRTLEAKILRSRRRDGAFAS